MLGRHVAPNATEKKGEKKIKIKPQKLTDLTFYAPSKCMIRSPVPIVRHMKGMPYSFWWHISSASLSVKPFFYVVTRNIYPSPSLLPLHLLVYSFCQSVLVYSNIPVTSQNVLTNKLIHTSSYCSYLLFSHSLFGQSFSHLASFSNYLFALT